MDLMLSRLEMVSILYIEEDFLDHFYLSLMIG